jgi:hypothetical protein
MDNLEGMIEKTFASMNKAFGSMDATNKLRFCQWLTHMSLEYKKPPEEILRLFKKSIKVIK